MQPATSEKCQKGIWSVELTVHIQTYVIEYLKNPFMSMMNRTPQLHGVRSRDKNQGTLLTSQGSIENASQYRSRDIQPHFALQLL
jgi:hypothetical protein